MDKAVFFSKCRDGVMGPKLEPNEVSGAETILDIMIGNPVSWCAYALATAWHETAHSMQPIKEYGGPSYFTRMYDPNGQRGKLARSNGNINPGDGIKFCGRGYVQLTWRNNYRKFGNILNVDLENNPDLAMNPEVAAKIMKYGMETGEFTGRSFKSFLPNGVADRAAFVNARRIINGSDKAGQIADYALLFQTALLESGW